MRKDDPINPLENIWGESTREVNIKINSSEFFFLFGGGGVRVSGTRRSTFLTP